MYWSVKKTKRYIKKFKKKSKNEYENFTWGTQQKEIHIWVQGTSINGWRITFNWFYKRNCLWIKKLDLKKVKSYKISIQLKNWQRYERIRKW